MVGWLVGFLWHINLYRLFNAKFWFTYIYIYIYEVLTISFQTFFRMGIQNCCKLLKIQYVIAISDDWPIFMISPSNEQLQQQFEYILLKPDCHSWWSPKMQSDTLEEWYAIKFCFKLGKKCHRNVWNASGCSWSTLHESSISFWVA